MKLTESRIREIIKEEILKELKSRQIIREESADDELSDHDFNRYAEIAHKLFMNTCQKEDCEISPWEWGETEEYLNHYFKSMMPQLPPHFDADLVIEFLKDNWDDWQWEMENPDFMKAQAAGEWEAGYEDNNQWDNQWNEDQ